MTAHDMTGQPSPGAPPSDAENAMMDRFVSDYFNLLEGRLLSIADYIHRVRYEEARVAILSLESASGMIGEFEMVRILHDLRLQVDSCGAEQAERLMTQARQESEQVRLRRQSV